MSDLRKVLLAVGLAGVLGTPAGVGVARAAFGDRITIEGTEFRAGAERIWINGANTPWHVWNEFGGGFDPAWWDKHFQELRQHGINATRIWISCNGEVGIRIEANGVDANGGLARLGPATRAYRDNHPGLVFPGGVGQTKSE
jgi:hypothetical protein